MGILVKIGADMSSFQKELNKATKEIQKAGKAFQDVGKDLTAKLTVPLTAIGTVSAKTAIDFGAAMSEVGAIAGASGEDMEKLRDKAKEMGASTKFSASDSAEALKYMAMAGWDTNDMLDGISGVMSLAAASGEELGVVSDILTDSMTAFGLSAKDSAMFADVLAQASAKSNTNVGMLGESFKYVAPVAGAMGYSVQDVSTALGLMANAGIKGSQSGTALRTMMVNLTKPTDDAAALMNELGISITNQDGTMKSFAEVTDNLRSSFSGLTADQQASYAATIFGKEAMSGALAIINTSTEDYNSLSSAINNSEGAAKLMSDTMMNNTAGSIEQMKSALEGAAISIGEKLEPTIRSVADWIAKMASKFSELDAETVQNIVTIGAIIAAIGPLLIIIGKAITITGQLKATFVILKTSMIALNAPVALIVGAIVGLIAIFATLYATNEEFRAGVNEIWEMIKEIFVIAIDAIKLTIETFINAFKELWESNFMNIQGITKSTFELISNIFKAKLQVIKDLIGVFKAFITGDWDGLCNALNNLWGNLWDSAQKIWESWSKLVMSFVEGFASLFTNVFEGLKTGILNIWNGILSGIVGFINQIVSAINGMINGINKISFDAPDWVPVIGGKSWGFNIPNIPKISWHADGGIFTKPTVLGGHGFGEAGKEAILPLNKLPKLLDMDSGKVCNINLQVDGYTLARVLGEPLREQMNLRAGSMI